MLEAPKSLITSALVSLVPRQIMLASKHQAVSEASIKDEGMKSEKKKKKSKSKAKQSETLGPLLSSVASFLESNGFDKTLAVFRSEAQIESDDLKASDINLEELFCKFLDSSKGHEEATIDLQRDVQKNTVSKKDESENAHEVSEEIHKKRRKHKKEKNGVKPDENGSEKNDNQPNDLANAKDLEKLNSADNACVETKDKKRKKKHKISSDAYDEDTKSRDSENVKEIIEEKIGELKSLIDSSSLPSESNAKEKGEKKKKLKATSNSLPENGNEYTKNNLEEKSTLPVNDDNIKKKSHKKRKRLASEEQSLRSEKKSSTEQSEGVENHTEFVTPQKSDNTVLENEQTLTSQKRKTEKITEAVDQIFKKSIKEHESSAQDVQKESEVDKLPNGNLEKSGKEGGTASKSKKKEKPSAEPKTVNAFQRVKVDEVKFVDERLQDNSYWALDSTGSGYGAKAQEILEQVKGRDFRHEKTKKKRGTYRGGLIDQSTRSVKFNYSDDE